MGAFKPNKQQQEFIDSDGTNVLVSASAGSGKTSTMITKLVNLISLSKVDVSSLLVVTYTNAAASEIKLKLYDRLSQLIIDTEDVSEKTYFKRQLDGINNAEIGTLHSICKKLISKYFYELGESPDFKLLTDKGKETQYFFDMAIKNVFNKHISVSDEEFFNLYDCYNSKRSDSELKKLIVQLYTFKTARIDYHEWKKSFIESSYESNLDLNTPATFLLEYYQKRLLNCSNDLMALLSECNSEELIKYKPCLDVKRQFIDEFVSLSSFSQGVKILFNFKAISKPTKTKTASVEVLDFDEKVENFNKYFSDIIKSAKVDFMGEDLEDTRLNLINAKNNLLKLLEILEEVDCEYHNLKKKKNCLDFNDLEDKMIQLLKNDQIRQTLMQTYLYVFVDEYQDINEKQEYILSQLVSGNNYYMIGDVKQSIYAFRQSSPKIFISKYREFSSSVTKDKVINFNENYRSNVNILEFANKIFDSLILENTIGINYKKDARFVAKNLNKGNNVHFDILRESEETENKEQLEALLIVKRILQLKTMKKENGDPFDYKDIAIILRKRGTFAKTLYEMLSKYQIPATTSIPSEFFTSQEIVLLISILKCVSNVNDDISIVTVLKNLFDITENDLISIRNMDIDSEFYKCIKSYNVNDEIKIKLNKFEDFIQESKNLLVYLTIKEYLLKVLDKYEILLREMCNENGKEREININEFLSLAENDNYKYNLDKFLEYLEFVSQDNSTQVVGSGDNSIQICTIHYSKGLEYPAVILGGLGKNFQLNKDSGNIIISNNFGVGIKSVNSQNRTLNDTIVRSACKISNKQTELNEEIRLLYVATTRARENLSLIGTYDFNNYLTHKNRNIYSSSNFFDMIFKCIPSVYDAWFENKKEFNIFENEESEASVTIYDSCDIFEENCDNNNQLILQIENNDLTNAITCVYNKKLSSQTFTVKNTVTNILKEEVDYENLNFEPKKLDVSDNVVDKDYLKIGTAYHRVMQEINFTENKSDVEHILGKLVLEGDIDKGISKFINIDDIVKAISVVGDNVKNCQSIMREKQFLLCENYNKLVQNSDNNTKVIIQGVIDLVLINEDGVSIIDYKTNNTTNEQMLIDNYKMQLQIYALAFEKATNLKVNNKFLYSFKMGKLIKVE